MKTKYIGLGDFPSIHKLNRYRNACIYRDDSLYFYFKTKKGLQKVKVFKKGINYKQKYKDEN